MFSLGYFSWVYRGFAERPEIFPPRNRRKWYEKLYETHQNCYEKEPYISWTRGEVDFVEKEISYNRKKKILDIGCGTGRHLLELARRGYERLLGVDVSPVMVSKARQMGEDVYPKPEFLNSDARTLKLPGKYDLALVLYEGGFSLSERDEVDFRILQNIARSLNRGGKLIMTVPHARFFLRRPEEAESFDPITCRESFVLSLDKKNSKVKGYQRFYMPSEISWWLKSLGFKKMNFAGCSMGSLNLDSPLTEDHFEMLVVGEK